MKIIIAVLLLFLSISHPCNAQDVNSNNLPGTDSLMQDTTIARDPHFNVYALPMPADEMQDTIIARDPRFVVREMPIPKYEMQDTVILKDPFFVIPHEYQIMDSLEEARKNAERGNRNPLAISLGNALMRAAEMQDTVIFAEPSFQLKNSYARLDSITAIKDSALLALKQSAVMQDTTIVADPLFVVGFPYGELDSKLKVQDSLKSTISLAASMQDTTIFLDSRAAILRSYVAFDSLEMLKEIAERPTIMQDTVIALDPRFVLADLYAIKDSLNIIYDSLKSIQDSLTAIADSAFADSVSRHWAGWKKFQVQPEHSFSLNTKRILKGKSKSELQYNIADFYLYLNGEPVKPEETDLNFFAAGCLGFRYDDTVLLNSGLGFKVGVGVGIKIFDDKFTSSLHANKRNTPVYKWSREDSTYSTNIVADPVSQSLILQYSPDHSTNAIFVGEYQASYKRFYEKDVDGRDEPRKYSVRIIFNCRVSGGLQSIPNSPSKH